MDPLMTELLMFVVCTAILWLCIAHLVLGARRKERQRLECLIYELHRRFGIEITIKEGGGFEILERKIKNGDNHDF